MHKYLFRNRILTIPLFCFLFLLCSCNKTSIVKENAEKHLISILSEKLKDPSSLKINDIVHVFTNDSLAIIHTNINAKNSLGLDVVGNYEYIYIDLDTIKYEAIHAKSNDSIFLSKIEYNKTKEGMIYDSLSYEDGMYYLAASYINNYGHVIGDKSHDQKVNITLPTKTGKWLLNYFINDFGEKTNEKYLSLVGHGFFSNSATTNSKLSAILIVSKNKYMIRLVEYDSYVVKDSEDCIFKIKDSDGFIYEDSFNNSKDGFLTCSSYGDLKFSKFSDLLRKGGNIIFSGTMGHYSKSEYVFSFNTDGFESAYNYLFSKEDYEKFNYEKKFIENLKRKDSSVKTTKSGLSYKIYDEGVGPKATDKDFVKVIYVGKLIDDTVFDDSKGEAREFPISGVVPGFAEGLKLLGKGGKATFYIPGELGYGIEGQPIAGIGSNATLIFDVEVTDIVKY